MEVEFNNRKRKREIRKSSSSSQSPPKKAKKAEAKPISRSNILAKMQNIFNGKANKKDEVEDENEENEEDEIENLESEFLSPFECGFCLKKFSTAEKIEGHVSSSHQNAEKEKPKKESTEKERSKKEPTEKERSKKESIEKSSKIDLSGDILDEITDDFVNEIENENLEKQKKIYVGSTELSRRLVNYFS